MAYRKCISMLTVALVGAMVVAPVAADMERRYLAIDQSLHAGGTTLNWVLGQTSNTQEMTLIDAAWKAANDVRPRPIGNVFVDHEGKFRMYYSVAGTSSQGSFSTLAVATSTDGYNWDLPALNIATHLVDHPDANVIHVPVHQAMSGNGNVAGNVFLDPSAPPSERYKLIWTTSNSTYGAVSSDGLTFGNSSLLFEHRNEHLISAFYDTQKEQIVTYGRIRGNNSWVQHNGTGGFDPDRRGAAMHTTSGNFLSSWDDAGNTMLDPEQIWDYPNETIRPDFYNPGVFEYHGQYIALPSTYYRDEDRVAPDRPDRWTGTGPQYPTLAHSNNGVNFTLADLSLQNAHPFFDPTPNLRINPRPDGTNTTDLEVGQLHASPSYIQVSKEKMLFHYFSRDDTHYEPWDSVTDTFTQWVSELRTDGFASFRAEEGESGAWHTPGITIPTEARGLEINAKVDGTLRVEIWQPLPFPGQKLAESLEFTGDKISHLVRWDGLNFEDLVGQNVQFRFFVEHGEIYSFQFSPIPEPVSLVLMGMGSLALLRRSRRAA